MDNTRGIWRGKCVDNGEWVKGGLVCDKYFDGSMGYFIFERNFNNSRSCTIDPSTLGEYTGLRDKNGKLIFEGDICKDKSTTYLIIWNAGMYQWQCRVIQSDFALTRDCNFPLWQYNNCQQNGFRSLEIIGNIHDTPELLKGGKQQ